MPRRKVGPQEDRESDEMEVGEVEELYLDGYLRNQFDALSQTGEHEMERPRTKPTGGISVSCGHEDLPDRFVTNPHPGGFELAN